MSNLWHGIISTEVPTSLVASTQVETGITVAIGTAPIHLATEPASVNKPVLAYKYSEAVKQLGYSDDFETFTLCGAMKNFFSLYNIAPVIFINVFDPAKHYDAVEKTFTDSTSFTLKSDYGISDLKITTGKITEAMDLELDSDYEIIENEVEDIDEETTYTEKKFHLISIESDNVAEDCKVTIYYKVEGDAAEKSVTVDFTNTLDYVLPTDTIVSSIYAQSGEDTNTLRDVNFKTDENDNEVTVTILLGETLEDNQCKVSYHALNPAKVTAADIIGGVDIATGKTTGIELVESVHPMFRIVPGTLIAPKYSLDAGVTAALVAKAKKVSGFAKAMAITDLDTTSIKTYTAAVEAKNSLNLSDPHLIVCYPMVKNGDDIYYMSTHLAALMAQVDSENGSIPYVSPSNQSFQMDAAVLEDGTEIFLTRDQANLLNQNGIVTAFNFNSWKAWGNYTSVYPASLDVKEIYIPVRRMTNFLTNKFATDYISKLDMPVTRRMIDSILTSANIYLNGLVNRGALLGGRLEFPTDENSVTDLLNGSLTFHLYFASPVPAQQILFRLEYDINYINALLA